MNKTLDEKALELIHKEHTEFLDKIRVHEPDKIIKEAHNIVAYAEAVFQIEEFFENEIDNDMLDRFASELLSGEKTLAEMAEKIKEEGISGEKYYDLLCQYVNKTKEEAGV